MKGAATAFLSALLLNGCVSVSVPEVTWYRLPDPVLPALAPVRFTRPVDVAVFSADGIYSEQALIYALGKDGQALRTYHYRQWSDPPTRMLQRRLIRVLRDGEAAPQVSDRLPASANALRISALIQRFERVEDAGVWYVDVALQLRVEHAGVLLAEETYSSRIAAADAEIPATIAAYGQALDQIYAAFIARLADLSSQVRA
ncbi:MAG: membrane integrity-associated transporter subunit PqiC [Rhodanobacteraceae bacterium]|nr:membrane integrity-associated transporter subunit PqiC [Rhodanobacteraceae bacterium]